MMHSSDAAWHRPGSWPTCDRRDVHVWRASLTIMAGRDHFRASLSADERSRAARFHFSEDSERFTVSRGLLRAILGRYTRVDPAAFVFSYSSTGKPAIEAPAEARLLSFNVSHSADVALIAVGRDRSIGVDVERLREIDALEIPRRFFSPAEVDELHRVSGAERQRAFFSYWTRREAVLKACGEGLGALDRVQQRLVDGHRCAVVDGHDGPDREWAVIDLDPGAGYLGALAAGGRDWTLGCWDADLAW
jgi:4'-phosphopantetheinyl transferase